MNNKLFFLPLAVIVIISVIAGGYFWWPKGINIFSKKTASTQGDPGNPITDILYLTNPVMEFPGKIDKISDNSIFVSGKFTITPPPTPINAPTTAPGQVITVPPLPPSKTLTYKVNILPYTVINRPESPVKYLLKKNTPTPTPKLTIKDMQVDQIISVSAISDLRTLKSAEFDAVLIKLPPIINIIAGKIASINFKDGLVILKAIQPIRPGTNEPTPEKPKELEYAISVTQDTEISRMGTIPTPAKSTSTPKPAAPLEFKLSDLKNDILITVYTDSDVINNQKVKALLIEPPIDLVPASEPSSSDTPSPTPKT